MAWRITFSALCCGRWLCSASGGTTLLRAPSLMLSSGLRMLKCGFSSGILRRREFWSLQLDTASTTRLWLRMGAGDCKAVSLKAGNMKFVN